MILIEIAAFLVLVFDAHNTNAFRLVRVRIHQPNHKLHHCQHNASIVLLRGKVLYRLLTQTAPISRSMLLGDMNQLHTLPPKLFAHRLARGIG